MRAPARVAPGLACIALLVLRPAVAAAPSPEGRGKAFWRGLEKRTWTTTPPDPATLDASQNARNLLRSLHVLLSLPVPSRAGAPGAGEAAAREKVLATVAAIRRS
jgi:hypothetical protein